MSSRFNRGDDPIDLAVAKVDALNYANARKIDQIDSIDLAIGFKEDEPEPREEVNHPDHYGGASNPYEAIKVIEAWALGFCLGNVVKYVSRAGKKPSESTVKDLKKARWYLDREIQRLSSRLDESPTQSRPDRNPGG